MKMHRGTSWRTAVGRILCLALVSQTILFSSALAGGTLTLLGQIDPRPGVLSSDVTGWVDPSDGTEYAIIGEWFGGRVYLVDVSDPTNPSVTGTIFGAPGFDFKVWGNHLYLVDGNGDGNDGEIWDISTPSSPTFVSNFLSAHNIYIDDQGYMYNEVSGLTILDLNADPTVPLEVWSGGTGGHDATVAGDILYDFRGSSRTKIWNVADRENPAFLGNLAGHGIVYHHSGAVSADGKYLYLNDELPSHPQPDIMVFDVSTPASPVLVDSYTDPFAGVHNSYRVGNFLFVSYYVAGFRVFDVSDPLDIQLVDEYDTSPAFSGENSFHGAWGCFPYTPSGNIYISDMENGLHIFSFTPTSTAVDLVTLGNGASLHQNMPNPVRFATSIRYELPGAARVELAVFNALGQRVRTLVNRHESQGSRQVVWDARDDRSLPVAAGTYFYRLAVNGESHTRKLLLVR